MISIYASILAEAQRLKRIGAIERRGRPNSDPELLPFSIESRSFVQALKNMPPSVQREWATEIAKVNRDVVGKNYIGHAQISAHTRRKSVDADTQLLKQARSIAAAKKQRIEAVKAAIERVKVQGHKVKSKSVAKAMKELGLLDIQPDTVRKLLTQIRLGRAT